MPSKTAPQVEVIVTVADTHVPKIKALATRLKAKGLTVNHTLESAGTITGTASQAAVAELKKVAGVQAVEAAGGVQIAPPDAEVQ